VSDTDSPVLPTRREHVHPPPVDPKEVTKICLRLKHQIEQIIPYELEEEKVTKANSPIITQAVLTTANKAGSGGEDKTACVVFCLLIVKKWFKKQATAELWDADLHDVRAVAAEMMAKRIIEAEEDMDYLFEEVLLKRYSILVDGEPTEPANAVEKAVDLHAVTVIGSSGYQKCISYLWRGWIVQDDEDPTRFVQFENKTNTNLWAHLDPDRMRVPRYQNWVQIIFSLVYLGLYTGAINTINADADLDIVEGLLYIFTLGFICDEVNKFYKVGRFYLSFWNMFNSTLYALLTVSFVFRMVAISHSPDEHNEKGNPRGYFNELGYNFLAFTAPMFWMRLLLYFDTFRFFGAMLVVLKVMFRESLIFFLLLFVVLVGFLQAFMGLDIAEDQVMNDIGFVMQAMLNAIMQSPEFEGFDNFAVSPPLVPRAQREQEIPPTPYLINRPLAFSSQANVYVTAPLRTNPLLHLYLRGHGDPAQHPHRALQLGLRRHNRQRDRRIHGALLAENNAIRPRPRRKRLHRAVQPHRNGVLDSAFRMVDG
jgi:hypothetical protein